MGEYRDGKLVQDNRESVMVTTTHLVVCDGCAQMFPPEKITKCFCFFCGTGSKCGHFCDRCLKKHRTLSEPDDKAIPVQIVDAENENAIIVRRLLLHKEITLICLELDKAEAKHKNWQGKSEFWKFNKLVEEMGEASQALNDWQDEDRKPDQLKKFYQHELRQTAAMCLRNLLNMED